MKAIVLLNAAAGTLRAAGGQNVEGKIAKALGAAGVCAEVRPTGCHFLRLAAAQIAQERSVDLVIGAGGDGTLSAIASGLAGTNMPLGVLPLGTLNHFAKDLRIPLDLAEASSIIAAHHVTSVDVGQVNDRYFINNSSLGMYPRAVLEREGQPRRRGCRKWVAMTRAMVKVLRRFPMVQVRLTSENQTAVRKTPMVFVGNNRYELDRLRVGTRDRVDRGELCLYIADTQTRWGMLKLTFRALLGRLDQARDFEADYISECWIEARRHRLHVALDGEVVKLSPPLHYRIWAKALRVCTPEQRSG